MTKSHKFYHPPNSSPKMRPSLFLKDEVLKPEDKSVIFKVTSASRFQLLNIPPKLIAG